VLPAVTVALVAGHIWLSRRHGVAPRRSRATDNQDSKPWWPYQSVRNLFAIGIVFALLIGYVQSSGGAGLDAPNDPTAAYEARPLWYFRWLFLLRKLFGSFENVAAMMVPAVVLGFLAAMPWIDRGPSAAGPGCAARRRLALGGFALICTAIAGLTLLSVRKDAGDVEYGKHVAESTKLATKARRLAKIYGVPARGGTAVFQTVPMWQGRTFWKAHCESCHQGKERKGPLIDAGYGSRAWIARFLTDPSGDEFFGRTKLAKSENAMEKVKLTGDALAAMVELVYVESGAADADPKRADTAVKDFEEHCADCHSREDGVASSGPALARRGTIDHLVHFIGNPKAPIHLGAASEMARFDREITMSEREAIAKYLIWLRSATAAEVAKMEPL
jgi:mono/diheme cytochrome c family protein